jgi:hypothetical protein
MIVAPDPGARDAMAVRSTATTEARRLRSIWRPRPQVEGDDGKWALLGGTRSTFARLRETPFDPTTAATRKFRGQSFATAGWEGAPNIAEYLKFIDIRRRVIFI